MKELVVASNNKGKIAEIKEIFGHKFRILTLADLNIDIDVPETGETFFDNALIKAKAIYDLTGIYALADDSGICAESLDGAPGVYSARFAGEPCDNQKNNELLLEKLKSSSNRRAKFCSSVVLYAGEQKFYRGFGETKGEILSAPQGGGGFGYDPIFFSYDLNKSFGLAAAEEKNSVSHRRRALDDLVKNLPFELS